MIDSNLVDKVNIPELVKALRYCAESGDFNCNHDCPMYPNYPRCLTKMDMDAAAAIEELQAEIRESMQKCAECSKWNEPLQVGKAGNQYTLNEPKRGEWIIVSECKNVLGDTITIIKCPFCAKRETLYSYPLPKYCDSCGAKMEVQE